MQEREGMRGSVLLLEVEAVAEDDEIEAAGVGGEGRWRRAKGQCLREFTVSFKKERATQDSRQIKTFLLL